MGRELSEREGILLNKDEEVSGEVVYGFEHCGWRVFLLSSSGSVRDIHHPL